MASPVKPAPPRGEVVYAVPGEKGGIQRAVDRAAAGGRVCIRAGHYKENFSVDKELDIFGDGVTKVTIEPDDHKTPAMTYHCLEGQPGKLNGICFKSSSKGAVGVLFAHGKCFVEDCRFEGFPSCAVQVKGDGNPQLCNVHFVDIKGIAVWISDTGVGKIDKCVIERCGLAGVRVESAAIPGIYNSVIRDCTGAGIAIGSQGNGHIQHNEIYNNYHSGIEAERSAAIIIEHNKIYGQRKAGVLAYRESKAIVRHNEIFRNAWAGVMIDTLADPKVLQNDIHDNEENGIFVHDFGRGVIEKNKIHQNHQNGISIQAKADPIITANVIERNRQAGVSISNGGEGVIKENTIARNGDAGIEVESGMPDIRPNDFRENKQNTR